VALIFAFPEILIVVRAGETRPGIGVSATLRARLTGDMAGLAVPASATVALFHIEGVTIVATSLAGSYSCDLVPLHKGGFASARVAGGTRSRIIELAGLTGIATGEGGEQPVINFVDFVRIVFAFEDG